MKVSNVVCVLSQLHIQLKIFGIVAIQISYKSSTLFVGVRHKTKLTSVALSAVNCKGYYT